MQFIIQIVLTISIFGIMAAGPIVAGSGVTDAATATGVLPSAWINAVASSGLGGIISMVLIWMLRDQSKRHRETVVSIIKDLQIERKQTHAETLQTQDMLVDEIKNNTKSMDNMANKIDKLCEKNS